MYISSSTRRHGRNVQLAGEHRAKGEIFQFYYVTFKSWARWDGQSKQLLISFSSARSGDINSSRVSRVCCDRSDENEGKKEEKSSDSKWSCCGVRHVPMGGRRESSFAQQGALNGFWIFIQFSGAFVDHKSTSLAWMLAYWFSFSSLWVVGGDLECTSRLFVLYHPDARSLCSRQLESFKTIEKGK